MFGYVARQYRWYKLEFGLTMLSWWEVTIFSTSRRCLPRRNATVFRGETNALPPLLLGPADSFLLVVLSVTGYYLFNFGSSVVGMIKNE